MAVENRRIGYIADKRSDVWISDQTGIPRSTLGAVRRGERTLPTQYRSTLRKAYQRESYRRLGDEGFSPTQARRFSSYIPESAKLKAGNMRMLVDDMTLGQVSARLKRLGLEATEDNILSIWNETREGIVRNMKRSKKTWEQIQERESP